MCPANCNKSVSATCNTTLSEPTCCHSECLGGCTGNRPSDCVTCRNVFYQGICQKFCPAGTYMVSTMTVYMYKYIHAYMQSCICMYMIVYIYTYIHTYIHAYIHTCIYTCIFTCIFTYIHACICTCIHTNFLLIRKTF